MKQSKVEKKNEFNCIACNARRLRGVEVRVKKGGLAGCRVTVCQSPECAERAERGEFASIA